MGLSAREQRALRSIEGRLTVSAPQLASRLAVFTRLNAGEAFPASETIRSSWSSGGFPWPLVWPALWLVITVALIAAGVAVGHDGGHGTCYALLPSCTWHTGWYTPW
jgi:fatty acid desaturase